MKILIACGGTGGHLFPGLAVAETLRSRRHQVELLVSEKTVDSTALSAWTNSSGPSGITVRSVPAIGFGGARRWIGFCRHLARATGACAHACRDFEADAVLGMGGFTSAPAVLATRWRRGVAALIHESNAVPGKANRLAGAIADHIAVGLADCARHFPVRKPVTVTGTPVRRALRRVPDAHKRLGLEK